ncbi:MAG TPA: M20/M25/M40 family metallo-hydrolase [Acidobacteriota bacterium]|nr:M20/M25/M40 family metallo-hydrolase [Acidobacteriota bacterium]HQF87840.1 M20/M25/M40 family metallo-hydrolase [Acidobacteriota bacterium]HQG92556.1 M20/M25/M40 family metallo-hydrolase [Acidobacteriota bacterium]
MAAASIIMPAAETNPAADPVTAERLKEHCCFLAADALAGRSPGSEGFRIAAEYAVSRFRAAGVKPAAGPPEAPTYLQPVPLVRRTVTEAAQVDVRTSDGILHFPAGHLKLFALEGLVGDGKPLPVVFAGFGIHEPEAGWDDFKGLDVSGRAVLLLMGAPVHDGRPVLPENLHRTYAPMNSVLRKLMSLRGVAAALVLPDAELAAGFNAIPDVPDGPQFGLNDPAPGAFGGTPLGVLSAELGRALFSGQAAPDPATVSAGQIPPGPLAGVTLSITVPVQEEAVDSWNVLGLVEGTDPALKEQVVVVSAHLDHLPPAADGQIFPGANDNASGVAALLEIARVVAAQPPRRSVLFAVLTGEEGGSMGARYFLTRGSVDRTRIVADLNMDMIGRTEDGASADRPQYALDSDRVTPSFTRIIETVNERTVRWPLKYVHPKNLGSSDHYVFDATGIPAVNFYSGRVSDTHKPTDTPDRLDYDKMAHIARLVLAVTLEIANREPLW